MNTLHHTGERKEPVPYPHPACFSDEKVLAGCDFSKGRAGGPGGQHRNKVETLVLLHHRQTGVEAHAGERRSASENKNVALFRLRLALATEVRCAVPKGDAYGDARSELWRMRCPDTVISCNPEHRDYPSLLAEAMDNIAASGYDESKAAARLCCTVSQLVKLVKEHAPALVMWNAERKESGRHPLR